MKSAFKQLSGKKIPKIVKVLLGAVLFFSLAYIVMGMTGPTFSEEEIQKEIIEKGLKRKTELAPGDSSQTSFIPKEYPQREFTMEKQGDHYFINVPARDINSETISLKFKVSSQVIEDLGFTASQIGNSCLNMVERSREKTIIEFTEEKKSRLRYVGPQEVRYHNGAAMVIVSGDILDEGDSPTENGNFRFVAKASKDGKCGPMEAIYFPINKKERLESSLNNKSR